MKRRIASIVMAGIMTLSMMGCGSASPAPTTDTGSANTDTKTETAQTTEETKTEDTTETAAASTDEPITLNMWCIATESDSNRHAYEAAIAEMAEKYPNITLNWEAFENQSYKTKIKAAVSANEMPDIFFTWSCAFLGDFVDADKVYCLDDIYPEFASELPENMLGNTTYNGKHYGVPTTMNIVGLFANMDLLAEVGYTEVPGTYEEFIACCDALKAKGIIPFGCAGKETWCVTEYLESVIEKSVGADTLNDIFLARDTWNNPEVGAAVDTFQKLVNDGYFDPSGIGLTNDEVKNNFMAGKYAFYMNGTWNCADFAANEEFLPKVKVAEFPVINADKAKLGQLIGGPSDTLAVAASSPNAEVAARYAMELGKLICHYGYLDGCGLPAWTPYGDTSTINPLTQTVAEICANADSFVLFGDTAMSADDANTYLSYVDQVYGCLVDGNQFIEGLAKDIR
ncbi:sugar ABC transporter substrate-binding protein [Butyrivibrio proteoclasticus B316]|uniref:Sugar ABC transporter substrate-binding protein n=1 Tax=Butyrivibrio proteoclasticus (strain ATCC 51982 / DSM 14932 / B316) TaxID=515622 RepID=E0RXN0_BUTPB|nr:extracellular solute-binding protein [Butyrivibrio proteoclasticus]ADL34457.1 sugar ABC transporter substrate-binding protein [Butyrivibrio proteoclasticus B316]